MNYKWAHFWGAISLLSLLLTTQAISAPYNGRFELYDYNSTLDINTPTGWQCEKYTAVVGYLIPNPEGYGDPYLWKINWQEGLFPFEGNHLLVLSTGNIRPEPSYAKIWQTITVEAGNKLAGVYFFGTCENYPDPRYNDFAEISFIPTADPNLQELKLVHVAVADVGAFGSMSGWKRFEHVFEANQAGTYDLTIQVVDAGDYIYNSYLAVDGLILCQNPPQLGDLSCDCTVNFQDFTLLTADWLCDCSNPLVYNDPNTNCLLGTDLTGDGPVDVNDLRVMSEYWLEGIKE